jgi:hypothetical protein
MTRFWLSWNIFATAVGLALATTPAAALNLVSFVSAISGNDANLCALQTAPCARIDAALAKTEPGGEIRCLDYSVIAPPLFIEKPVTIDCAPSAWIFGNADGNGITINLSEATYPNGEVTLRNLTINGLSGIASVSSADGIRVTGGGAAVRVENCTIQGFAQQGIDFAPSSSVDLFVRNTVISNNAGGGIQIRPTGAASAKVALDNVNVEGNGNGIRIDDTATSVTSFVMIRDSTIAGSSAFGIYSVDSATGLTRVTLEGSSVSSNGAQGVVASGAGVTVRMRDSTVTGNATGLQAASSSRIVSQGGNVVAGNTSNGAFTSTEAQQ